MGQGTSEAVARVEETRARLDAEVAELQRRVPPMVDKAKRTALTAAAALTAGVTLLVALRVVVRRRRARKAVPAPVRLLREARDQVGQAPVRLLRDARDQVSQVAAHLAS